jgi:Tfp pilus assembly PilM family ATPase/Tfp pilus assembly protein PilN
LSRLIVIDRGVQQVRFLECDTRGSRVVVRKASAVAIPDVPDSTEADVVQQLVLRELSAVAGSGAQVVGLIGRSHAVLRDLRLPDAPPEEMPGIVQLQAMRELSFPVEQAAIDYEVVGEPDGEGQRRVILAALQREVIDRFQRSIQSSQLQVSRVGLRPYATWRTYRAVSVVPNAAVLVVALAGQSLELTVGQGESVLFSRATLLRAAGDAKGDKFDAAPALLSEVRRTLAAFGNQVPGVAIERVALAAGPDEFQPMSQVLADADLGVPVDRFDPFQAVELSREGKQSLAASSEHGAYVGAIGAAVSAHEMWPIDFLNPKKPVEVRDRRKPMAILAAGAVVLLVVASYGIVQYQLSKGRERIRGLAERNAGLEKYIKDQSDIIRKHQAVTQWQSAGIDSLKIIEWLTEEHPATKEMYVTSLRIERDRTPGEGGSKIVLDGLARQQTTVSEFNTKLNDGEHFSARPVGATQRQKSGGDYSFSFKSDISVRDGDSADNSGSSAATTSSKSPSSSTGATGSSRNKSDSSTKGPGKKSR